MPKIPVTITGTGATHRSVYSTRRFCYYWAMGPLSGRKVTSVQITIKLRANSKLTTGYNIVIMNSFTNQANWSNLNANTRYQYPGNHYSYFNKANLSKFCASPLVDQAVTLDIAGGEGNKSHTFNIAIPANKQDISYWTGKDIFVNFYSPTDDYNPELCYGASSIATIVLTIQQSATVKYYNGSAWVSCIAYYWDGSAWIECIPKYYDGSAWVECDSG